MATKQTKQTKKTKKKKPAIVKGAGPAEVRAFLIDFAAGGYVPERFGDCVCACGERRLFMLLDDDAGVAIRACPVCEDEQAIGDSEDFIDDDTEPAQCECPCGESTFEATVGLALYVTAAAAEAEGTRAVRWVSIGLRCVSCSQIACYGDWKNEHDDVDDYLRRL